MPTILYTCDGCNDITKPPMLCVGVNKENLRVMPDDSWLCEICFNINKNEFWSSTFMPKFSDLPEPPKHIPGPYHNET